MASEKKPPIKLVWFEHVTDWLESRPEIPVSLASMVCTVSMVMRATTSSTNEALISARWVERMTGVNHRNAAKALDALESAGWLWWTQRRRNRVKLYQIAIPEVGTLSPHSTSGGDTSGDTSGDTVSHTPGTPGTPLEELTKGKAGFCANCLRSYGHDDDCAQRPFIDIDFRADESKEGAAS